MSHSDRIGSQVNALARPSRLIAVGVALFQAPTWERVGRLVGHTGRVNTLSFTRDGKRIVSGCSLGSVRVWDLERGDWRTACHEDGHEPPAGVAFAPDGERVAVGWDTGAVEIWNTRTRSRERVLASGAHPRHLDWSRDGALCRADGLWRLRRPAGGGRGSAPAPHRGPLTGRHGASPRPPGRTLRAWNLRRLRSLPRRCARDPWPLAGRAVRRELVAGRARDRRLQLRRPHPGARRGERRPAARDAPAGDALRPVRPGRREPHPRLGLRQQPGDGDARRGDARAPVDEQADEPPLARPLPHRRARLQRELARVPRRVGRAHGPARGRDRGAAAGEPARRRLARRRAWRWRRAYLSFFDSR